MVAPTGLIADGLATALFAGALVELTTRHRAAALRLTEDPRQRAGLREGPGHWPRIIVPEASDDTVAYP